MEPIGIEYWAIIIGILLLYLFPFIHLLVSSRSHGGAKFGWFLAILFFSYLAYLVFLIITQPVKDAQSTSQY